jgi:hypothetical protein
MPVYQVITFSAEYADALRQLQNDIPRYIDASGLPTKVTVVLPKPLVRLIIKYGDTSYETVKKSLTEALSQFCAIGEWSRGQDDRKQDYIKFKLLPERVRDGD